MPTHAEHIVGQLASALRQRFGARLSDIRLFGSWARGEQTSDSDIDVCVLIEHVTHADKIEVFNLAAELSWQHGLPISTLVMDPEEFQRLRTLEARLALDIEREGVRA